MAKLEQQARKRLRSRLLKQAILATIATAGMLGAMAVAPNVLGALGRLGIINHDARRKEIINRARDRLLKHGLLTRNKNGYLVLTQQGKSLLHQLTELEHLKKKPKRWDGKWRILIFDIPEYRKSIREKIRRTLSSIGFMRLQDSVWVYPYDCEDIIALLKADFRIGKDLLYLIIEEMEGDVTLRKSFGLSK